MSTYLYRAVAKSELYNAFGEMVLWPGAIIGRQSGYLSRSGASRVGALAGVEFEVVRSEPVVFLTRREKLLREIERLQSVLDAEVVG